METQKINRHFPYTPSRQKVEFLERTSVGCENLLKDLLASIKEQTQKKTHQHWLLIGPRGIGKSHIIALLNHRVKTTPKLHAKWKPIWIPEEAAGILTLRDFFEKIIRIYIEEFKTEEKIKELENFEEILESTHQEINDRRALNSMTAFLMDWKKRNQCKILVFLENANRVVGNRIAKSLPDEKWLRDLLMNKDLFLLIATSQSFFKQIENKDYPLFELFRIEMIEDFSFDESLELLIKYAEEDKRDDLVKQFKLRSNRIEALHTLTGGNPRLLVMLYMQSGGFIKRIDKPIKGRKGTLYRLSETIYRYWYQMNSERYRKMAEIFIRFIVLFYTYKEIKKNYTSRIGELKIEKDILEKEVDTPKELQYLKTALDISGRVETVKLMASLEEAINKAKPENEIEKICRDLIEIDHNNFMVINHFAVKLAQREELWKAVYCFKRNSKLADEIKNEDFQSVSYYNWGATLFELAELKSDEHLYMESFEKYALAWGLALSKFAQLKSDESLYRESFEKYALAVKHKEGYHEAYYNWGLALSDLAELKSDEGLYRRSFEKYAFAVKYKEDDHQAYYNWGLALSDLAELKSDESLYRRSFEKYALAVKYKEDKHEAYYNWGNALFELAELKSDESLYRESFEKYLNSWNLVRKIEKFDHPLMVNTALRVIFSALLIGEKDEADQTFFELLASLPKVSDFKVVVPYFFTFFLLLAKNYKEDMASNYLELLFNTKFKNDLNALIPLQFLFKYLTTKDDSIIRRQPPEIQKLLKSIIEEIEEG